MDTNNAVVDKICKWCGQERFELPSKILVCLKQCDIANNETVIPVLEKD